MSMHSSPQFLMSSPFARRCPVAAVLLLLLLAFACAAAQQPEDEGPPQLLLRMRGEDTISSSSPSKEHAPGLSRVGLRYGGDRKVRERAVRGSPLGAASAAVPLLEGPPSVCPDEPLTHPSSHFRLSRLSALLAPCIRAGNRHPPPVR